MLYVEPYHLVQMRRPIEYAETKSVLKSQLYPILDDKDSLYLKLNLALEHTLFIDYAVSTMYHNLCHIPIETRPDQRLIV